MRSSVNIWVINTFFEGNRVEGEIFGVHRALCGRQVCGEAVTVTRFPPPPSAVSDTVGESFPLTHFSYAESVIPGWISCQWSTLASQTITIKRKDDVPWSHHAMTTSLFANSITLSSHPLAFSLIHDKIMLARDSGKTGVCLSVLGALALPHKGNTSKRILLLLKLSSWSRFPVSSFCVPSKDVGSFLTVEVLLAQEASRMKELLILKAWDS